MKKIYLKVSFLSTMLMFISCGGGQQRETTEYTMSATEQSISDTLESELEEVVADSEESEETEEVVEEENENPKYDKILDEIEKDVKKMSEMASKIGDEYGILDITEKQQELQENMNKINYEELSKKQRTRYDKLNLEIIKAASTTAGSMLDVLI